MGLKNLMRQLDTLEKNSSAVDAAAEAFISAAPVSTVQIENRKRRSTSKSSYVRTTFSLSKDVNKQIDKLSLTPRNFRVSRSDVVRAGVMVLLDMDRAELLALLEKASKADPISDVMQDE